MSQIQTVAIATLITIDSFLALTMEQLEGLDIKAMTGKQKQLWVKAIETKEKEATKKRKEEAAKLLLEAKADEAKEKAEALQDSETTFEFNVRATNKKFGLLENGKPKSKWLATDNQILTRLGKFFFVNGESETRLQDEILAISQEITAMRKAEAEAKAKAEAEAKKLKVA